MMVSRMYIRPHEFIVLSPNIDVFCAKIQLPVIQHTFTFAGDHIVDLWWEQALLRLTNHDSGTIMPATEGSDVVKAGMGGGSGLEVNEGGMVESRTTSIPKTPNQHVSQKLQSCTKYEQKSKNPHMTVELWLKNRTSELRRRQHNIKPQQSISSSSIAPLLWISVQKPKGLSEEIIDKLSHQHEPAVLSIILFQRLSSVRIPQYNGCTTAVSNRTRNGSITPTNFASIQSTLDRNNFLPFSHEVMTGLELMTWGSFLWLCVSSSNFNKSYSKRHCICSKGLYDRQNYNDA